MPLTSEERVLLKDIYQRLDENKPLKPTDANYVELYQPVYEHPGCDDPVDVMQRRIEFSDIESVQLFSGFRGAGKTTELFRLKQRLEEAGCVVLYADALEYVSQSDEVDISNLLIVLAGAFSDALKEQAHIDIAGESYWQRFTNYLTRTTIDVTEATVKMEAENPLQDIAGKLKAGIDLKANIKNNPSFREKLAKGMMNRLAELKGQVDKFIEDGVKAIQKGDQDKRVVFIFDSLEQVRGSRINEQSVIRSVAELFAHYYPKMFKLPYVHAIYTVPPWLQFSNPNITKIVLIPCVRQWENDAARSEFKGGCDALYSLVQRRFGPGGFKRVFGESNGAEHNPLARQIIAMCGGHFRDLLYMLRETLLRAKALPVTPDVVETAIAEMRNHFRPIAVEDAHWLVKIGEQRDAALPTVNADDVQRLTRFLDTHFVLYFRNGEGWYDTHPLVRDEVTEIVQQNPFVAPTAAPTPVA